MHFLTRRCYLPVFPIPRKQKQEDQEFEPACLTQRALVFYKQIKENILKDIAYNKLSTKYTSYNKKNVLKCNCLLWKQFSTFLVL